MSGRVSWPALLICLLLLGNCNRLLWRDRTDFPAAAWLDEERLVESALRYEEKLPWDPLAGTTLKRNYRSMVRILKFSGGRPDSERRIAESPEFEGTAENGLYEFLGAIVLMRRVSSAGGMVYVDLLSWLPPRGEIMQRYRTPLAGATLARLVPSPDRRRLLLVLESERGTARVAIVESLDLAHVLSAEGLRGTPEVEGLSDLSWSRDSTRVFLAVPGRILEWDGRLPLHRALRFPRCFNPPTRYPGHISEEGVSFYRAGPENTAEIKPMAQWIRHDRVPIVSDLNLVGVDCL